MKWSKTCQDSFVSLQTIINSITRGKTNNLLRWNDLNVKTIFLCFISIFKIISSITSYSGVLVGICGRDLPPSSFKPDPYLDQPWFHTLLLFSDLNIGEIFSQDQPEWLIFGTSLSFAFGLKQIKLLDVVAIPFKTIKVHRLNGKIHSHFQS